MDDEMKEKLREKLEKGEISREFYDDLMKRWGSESQEKTEQKEPEQESEVGSDRGDKTSVYHISGAGNLGDVIGKELSVAGSGKVTGTVDVDEMSVSGSASVKGDVKVRGDLEVSGSLKLEESAEVDSLDVSGSFRAKNLKARSVDSSGWLSIEKKAELGSLDCSGSARFEDLTCDEISSSGSLKAARIKGTDIEIHGTIVSDEIECRDFELEVYGGWSASHSEIRSLKADDVEIGTHISFFRKGMVSIDEIQCKTADLEGVKARKVIGDEVVIGDSCEIDYVEAKVLKVSENAVVKERKINGNGNS